MILSKELRKKYIEFFKEKGHQEIPSASLVPENDPTVLFTTAGMHPLVPYLLGELHPEGKRLVNVQKCVRTGDIDDVGDSTHNTFFEMLGNWSLGDYFKKDSIHWSFEFLTNQKWLGINPEKIKVTVFKGDDDAPKDEESIQIWQECFSKLGASSEVFDKEKKNNKAARIFPLPKEDNWWGPAGQTGPCGPDTEIFIDLGKSVNFANCPNGDDCKPGCHCGRYIEIWNNVFMQYNKTSTGKYIPLVQKNVDTGMGMERTLAILNDFDNIYETDLLAPIIAKIKTLLCCHGEDEVQNNSVATHNESDDGIVTLRSAPLTMTVQDVKSTKIISDHIRTSVFMIADSVLPSNLDRGYILRRLLRRAIRHGNLLKLSNGFLSPVVETVIDIYKEFYPELEKNKDKILDEIRKEEEKFEKALERGLKEFDRYVQTVILDGKITLEEKEMKLHQAPKEMSSEAVFKLITTFGFPIELIIEEAKARGLIVNLDMVDSMIQKHQELSRTASAGKFKGGLADCSEETTRLHTTAHLLLESLRRVLGEHVFQKGSNITAERLRFDFSHPNKLTDVQRQKVEDLVNEQIKRNLPVQMEEMSLEEAKENGAMGVFESKYGEKVKVYTIGNKDTGIFSKEICGGPHIKNTSELGKFKIKKEESSSSGIRRIKAILG
ncbi:alanine--tRNA ligase [Patescibacteria group bacterium]|nr:alanine--tRNA ligase [Patescibacteria group bacterium]